MIPELRNNHLLSTTHAPTRHKRPLIGVPTGRENSERFHGLPLYIMNQTYIRVLESLGALPVMIPLGMSEATLQGIFERLDGLFLPGGEDIDPIHYGAAPHVKLGTTDPERDRTELLLTRWVLRSGMPFLGVCRGIQVLNVACGGSLYQDIESECPTFEKHDYMPPGYDRFRVSHQVHVEEDSHLVRAVGQQHRVNSMHHQGIDKLGAKLRVVARSADGLPEAIEVPQLPYVVGVQWHPEEMATRDDTSGHLFYNFVHAAANEWRPQISGNWATEFAADVAAISLD